MNRQEGLDKYVRRILKEKGLSLSDVEHRSRGGISDSHISNIASGNFGSLTIGKLKALARGLGVPEDEIFAVARGVPLEDTREFQSSKFATLFHKYKELPAEDKKEVLTLLEMLDREIEWRQMRRMSRIRLVRGLAASEKHEQSVAVADADWVDETVGFGAK